MGDLDPFQNSEDLAFIAEHVEPILSACIETVLKDKQYEEAKVPLWVDLICDGCMKSLTELNKPFKYIVSCIIMQRNGAGIHTAQSCHWDISNDQVARVCFPLAKGSSHPENRMLCIVTCFGVSM